MTLYDIAFIIVAISFITALIWELIPEGFKKFWKYRRELKRDKKKNRHRKYVISFR